MDMREFFEGANPTNLAQMIERMLEAERKEYWETDQDTLKQLVQTYLEIKRDHNVFSENEAFLDNLDQQAQGFGLSALLQSANASIEQELAQQAAASANSEQVEGQKLEEVSEITMDSSWDWTLFLSVLVIGIITLMGAFREWHVSQKPLEASSIS